MDVNTLDVLHITTLEEREKLLSAVYKELHPSSPITQRLDSLLGTFYHYDMTNKHSTALLANETLTGASFLSRFVGPEQCGDIHRDISVNEQI